MSNNEANSRHIVQVLHSAEKDALTKARFRKLVGMQEDSCCILCLLPFRHFHFDLSAWPMDHMCAGTLAQSFAVHY